MKEYKRSKNFFNTIKQRCVYYPTNIFKYSLRYYAPQLVTLEEYAEFGDEENIPFVLYHSVKFKLKCIHSHGRYYNKMIYIPSMRYIKYRRHHRYIIYKMSSYKKR